MDSRDQDQSPEQLDRPHKPSDVTRPREHQVQMRMTYKGPLPPPSALEAYEKIVPGGAERIFRVFENQSSHRQGLEAHVVRSNSTAQIVGLIFAGLIALCAVAGGIFLAHEGQSAAGLTSIIVALGSLVGVFVYQKRQQATELERKRPTVADEEDN